MMGDIRFLLGAVDRVCIYVFPSFLHYECNMSIDGWDFRNHFRGEDWAWGGVVGVGVGVETVSRSRQWRFLLCTLSYGYRLFLVDHLVGVVLCFGKL